jgi:hypothetical protein
LEIQITRIIINPNGDPYETVEATVNTLYSNSRTMAGIYLKDDALAEFAMIDIFDAQHGPSPNGAGRLLMTSMDPDLTTFLTEWLLEGKHRDTVRVGEKPLRLEVG